MRFINHQNFESYSGAYRDFEMHGQGTLYLRNGNVYMGGFANDKRHGMGYLLDYETGHKIREEWAHGTRGANAVSTVSTTQELDEHLRKEGYYYQNQ